MTGRTCLRNVLLLAVAAGWSCSCVAHSAEPARNVDELAERLEQLRRDVRIPAFSAAIACRDRIVWAGGFGLADIEAGIVATPKTRYHLASLTKPFASTILMQLVEAGQLDLDAPLSRYGVQLDSASTVCVKHLLSHTSADPPGQRFSYDGNRFALLTQVVRASSGHTFGELLCERIIRPLALNDTAPNCQDSENFGLTGLDRHAFESRLAAPYQLEKDASFKRIAYPPHFNCSAGLISTVLDVARFSIALDQGKLLSPASQQRVMTRVPAGDRYNVPYGLGWFVIERGGVKLVWHYGLWVGNSSLIIKVPDRQLTFVVLANSERLTSSYFHGRGELMTSPFARAFIEGFVSGDGVLPDAAVAQ
jgi:CubicO group peptidase (beta-lactamase class C family)